MNVLPKTVELRFRRTSVHRHHDLKRLDEGEDLNDALMDFFVKLGQAVIPCGGLAGGFPGYPSVAYLGSLFYDVLRKGGVVDGKAGHANVANWARRRLGEGGLFFNGIGALAVPVNETLRDANGRAAPKEKHWWVALLLNPRAGCPGRDDEDTSLLCLDSVVRADVKFEKPLRAVKRTNHAYHVEVSSLYRQGFSAFVRFRAWGDGSAGALPDPRKSRLQVGGLEFTRPQTQLTVDQRGSLGTPGKMEGTLEFILESASPINGSYLFDFADQGSYNPPLHMVLQRDASDYQSQVLKYLGGYVAKEWETSAAKAAGASKTNGTTSKGAAMDVDAVEELDEEKQENGFDVGKLKNGLRLPDVPQQETANDCGYFILAQILQALELTPDHLRILAKAPADLIASLPWPSQQEVTEQKMKLRKAMDALFDAADAQLSDDVDVLLKKDEALRARVQAAMWAGPKFSDAVRRLGATMAPKQQFYTMEELEAMPTKGLRNLCAQRGVLPNGMCERSDLVSALAKVAVRAPPPAEEPEASRAKEGTPQDRPASKPASKAGTNGAAAASMQTASLAELLASGQKRSAEAGAGPDEAAAKKPRVELPPDLPASFTAEELPKMSLKNLKGLCIKHRVLPAGALEKGEFVQALVKYLDSQKSQPTAAAAPQQQPQQAPQEKKPDTPEELAARKAKWAKAAGEHLAGVSFDMADLQVMPTKVLRGLCVQYKVMPASAVEKADFVRALSPLAGLSSSQLNSRQAAQTKAAEVQKEAVKKQEAPKKDFSRFLGQAKPNFTPDDLQEMPESTLRTLCIQHGVLPQGEAAAYPSELLAALTRIAMVKFAAPCFHVDDD